MGQRDKSRFFVESCKATTFHGESMFCDGLIENDISKLLAAPKSDLHNHSTKGCRRAWPEEKLNRKLTASPGRFDGIMGMQEWFAKEIKPFCSGREGIILRWEGAFAEAKRNNIKRLSMSFGVTEIELVGGMDKFRTLIESFCDAYCPDSLSRESRNFPA